MDLEETSMVDAKNEIDNGYILDSHEEQLADDIWIQYSDGDDPGENVGTPHLPSSREDVLELLAESPENTAKVLFAAVERRNVETLQLLLSNGISPNLRRSRSVGTPDANAVEHLTVIQIAASLAPYTEEQAEQQERMINMLLDHGADMFAVSQQQPKRTIPTTNDSEDNDEDKLATVHRQRSVLHSILEHGGYVEPFLNRPEIANQLEHRDPQGRTLLLSACRSALGADAAADARLGDVHWDPDKGSYTKDPFTRAEGRRSIFQALLALGADPTGTDRSGKNAIHHLLEAHDSVTVPLGQGRPPVIREALGYLLVHYGALVNQPDDAGTYPLQAALQRCRRYMIRDKYVEAAELEGVIRDIISAGADKKVLGEVDKMYLGNLGL